MSREQPHVARRSASHGALASSYAAQTRTSSDSGHGLPVFKPLRSIREHGQTFLDPAASADGMLRKTTETGNIGIFSMYAGRHKPLRPRVSLGDLHQPSRPLSRTGDRHTGHDDRRKLPSYRDSTSEIISMYGSENQSSSKSVSGTLSPPWDDNGQQRSYSMTTCGSKSHSIPKTYGGHHAQDFNARIQRPRSPYPYPTRLPRPGVRPSSPALTENGVVDYSRMVEIDRLPERTTLHPKALFPYKTTRNPPPPLSMRHDINQSTRSLSDDRGATRPYSPCLSRRPPLPNSLKPWGPRSRERLEPGSLGSDHSLRTMSLTSMSGDNAYAHPQTPRLQLPKREPMFYDYSEDFEDVAEPSPPDYPIAPTPKRVSNSCRSIIADGGCDAIPGDVDEVDYIRQATLVEVLEDDEFYGMGQYRPVSQLNHEHRPVPLPHQSVLQMDRRPVSQLDQKDSLTRPASYESAVDALTSSPMLPQVSRTVEASFLSVPALDDQHDAVQESQTEDPDRTTTAICLVSEDSTVESPLESETPAERPQPITIIIPRPDLASVTSTTLPCRYSCGRKDSRFFSLSSGLSDLASFLKYVDKHIQVPDSEDVDRNDPATLPASKSKPSSDHGWSRSPNEQKTRAPPRKSSLPQYVNPHFGSSTKAIAPVDELQHYHVISTRSGPTLVPQPISPAKLLRVKNSIPQLMKALPPLPDFDLAPDSPFGAAVQPIAIEPFELSRLTDARSTISDTVVPQSRTPDRGEEAAKAYDPYSFDRGNRKPKLKLKHAVSFAPDHVRNQRHGCFEQADATSSDYAERKPALPTEYSTAPVKRRLPLKVSRPILSSLAPEDNGTVKRRPGINKSSTVSNLTSAQPVDLFNAKTGLKHDPQSTPHIQIEQISQDTWEHLCDPTDKVSSAARFQRVPPKDDARGLSLDTQLDTLHSPPANVEAAVECEMQSFFSDHSVPRPQRGLRKRLSNLKSRFTEPRHHLRPPLGIAPHGEHGAIRDPLLAAGDPSSNALRDLLSSPSQSKGQYTTTPTRKVRSKLEKFMRGAKHKLQAWGRSKHRAD